MRDELVSSKYFILINSNTSKHDKSPEAMKRKDDFLAGLKRIFLSPNILNFIDVINPDDSKEKITDLIYQIKIELQLETAPNNGYVHCHVDLTIDHWTTIDVQGRRFTKFFKKFYNLPVFCPIPKLVPNLNLIQTRYLIKGKSRNSLKLRINSIFSQEDGPTLFFSKHYGAKEKENNHKKGSGLGFYRRF